jgi:large subunit ribosomal protein L30
MPIPLLNKEEFLYKKYLTAKRGKTMKKIRVKQVKSKIRRPQNQKRTLEALGLRKMNQVVEHNATPEILGMVNKVKHLLSVEEVK